MIYVTFTVNILKKGERKVEKKGSMWSVSVKIILSGTCHDTGFLLKGVKS